MTMETKQKPESTPRYQVVERWGGWKIWDTTLDMIGHVTYPEKEIADKLAAIWNDTQTGE